MKYLLLALPFLAFSQTHQLEKIVIGSKRELSKDLYTGEADSIVDLASTGNQKVLDKLQELPGVIVSQSGAPGQQASIFIRGSEARHVLVVIDGVRLNDPANPDKSFNSALLNVGDIEKVEVLKGAQSLLYGSEAIGGVVNIVTSKGREKNFVELYSGLVNGASIDNTFVFGKSVFHGNIFYEESDGISAAASGDEKDGFKNKGATLNFFHQFGEKLEADWTYKVMDQFVETDGTDFSTYLPIDSDEDYSKSIQQIFSQKIKYKDGESTFSYLLGANKMDRSNKSSGTVYAFEAIEYTNELHWNRKTKNGSFLIGLENLSQTFGQYDIDEKFAGLTSLLLIRDAQVEQWFWSYGLRASEHTEFGSVLSPSFGLGKFIGNHRVSFNYQQGFKSPTLYQLYGPGFGSFKVGNTELEPETSEYVDLNYRFADLVDMSLFYNRLDDYIDYVSSEGYINTIYLETYGLEASAKYTDGKNTVRPGVFLAHYFRPDKKETIRRPSQKFTLSYERFISERQRFILDYIWSAKMYDRLGSEEVELSPYDVFNVEYEFREKSGIYSVGVENLFGESYQQVYGYNTQPFTLFAKAKFEY